MARFPITSLLVAWFLACPSLAPSAGAHTSPGASAEFWVLTESGCPQCSRLPTDIGGQPLRRIDLDGPSDEGAVLLKALGAELPRPLKLPLFVQLSTTADGGGRRAVDLLEGYATRCLSDWKAENQVLDAADATESFCKDPAGSLTDKTDCGAQPKIKRVGGLALRVRSRNTCPGSKATSLAATAVSCDEAPAPLKSEKVSSADDLSRKLNGALARPEVWQDEGCRAMKAFSLPREGWTVGKKRKFRRTIESFPPGGKEGRRPVGILIAQRVADGGSQKQVFKQISALRKRDADISLALVTSFRESGSEPFQDGSDRVHSQKSGGLDNLAIQASAIRSKKLVPRGFDHWTPDPTNKLRNPLGNETHPVWIRRNELVVAYASVLELARTQFADQAQKEGFTLKQIQALSPRARRVWTTVFFMGAGGAKYGQSGTPGGITILTHLRALIQQGKAEGLEDVVRAPELRKYHTIMRGLVSATDAEVLESIAGI